MSKKCIHCGSYNTEIAVGNCVERAVVNTGRIMLSLGAGLIGSVFNPNMGGAYAAKTWEGTKQEKLRKHHCCTCGKDF